MRTRLVLAASVLMLFAATAMPTAHGLGQGGLGKLGPKNPHLEKSFGPIAAVYPASNSPRQPFAGFRPPGCEASAYCDYVTFEVDYPKSFMRDKLFGALITLTWENPRHRDKNPTGNDLDLFVWGDPGPAAGGPLSKCGSPGDDDCDDIHPESVALVEPDDTFDCNSDGSGGERVCKEDEDEPDPGAIYLTIVNDGGINTGYTLTVDWYEFTVDAAVAFQPPDREQSRAQSDDRVLGPFDDFDAAEALGAGADDDGPRATPRKILVPGPDGKMHEIELPVYAAGQRLPTTAARNTAAPWIVAGVVGVIALAVLIFVLVRRNRQAMQM